MDSQIYTEEELRALKYSTLLKITKERGLKTTGRRVKTDKLIEMILEAQKVPDMDDDVAAVCAALETVDDSAEVSLGSVKVADGETDQVDELLADIEFPEEPSPEIEPPRELVTTRRRGRPKRKQVDEDITNFDGLKETKLHDIEPAVLEEQSTSQMDIKATRNNSKEHLINAANKTTNANTAQDKKRPRRRTFDLEEKTDIDEHKPKAPSKRSRTSTFEISETKEEPETLEIKRQSKRQRTSTFELPAKVDVSSGAPDSQVEKLEVSEPEPRRVSGRKSSIQGSAVEQEAIMEAKTETSASEKRKVNALGITIASPKLPPKANTPRLSSIAKRKSLVITPAATPPVIHKVQKMIQGSAKTPGSDAKKLGSAKIVKPVFTVGRSDGTNKKENKDSKQEGSNIPRFLSYARKLKVPNFAKIHERAFNRMEALDDYVDKKRKRTNTVGSSVKKPQVDPEKVFKPAVTSVKNLNLNFAATKPPGQFGKTPIGNKTINTKSPRTATKSPKNLPKVVPGKSPKSAKKSPKVAVTLTKVKTTQKTTKTPTLKSPRHIQKTPRVEPKGEGQALSGKKVSSSVRVSALPRLMKENVKPATGSSLVSPAGSKLPSKVAQTSEQTGPKKMQQTESKASANKPAGYVPYKGAIKPLKDRATLKNMSERNPNIRSREQIREGQKQILKGVRFNKRFELQMARRGINLKE